MREELDAATARMIEITRNRHNERLRQYARELRRIADAIDRQIETGRGLYGSEGANLAIAAAAIEGSVTALSTLDDISGGRS